MRTFIRLMLLLALAGVGSFASAPAPAQGQTPAAIPAHCTSGTLPSKALSLICIPTSGWNGDLVIFAHGYVAPGKPLAIQDPSFGGATLSTFIQLQGYAFATTSYRRNGLAILEGADDIRELVAAFATANGHSAAHTYVLGFSEGGLIAAMLAEQSRTLFSGALAACGPVGDFKRQIEYFGDFRILFDYFFPGVIPPEPTNIPQSVIDGWETTYVPAVTNALSANPIAASQLISTSLAAIEPTNPASIGLTTQDLLWYNVFATNDARTQLGGNPYGNAGRVYAGSKDDTKLNATVKRYTADAAALAKLSAYQTTGRPQVPLILLHTTGDDVVPFWHATLYAAKAQLNGSRNVTVLPISRYGHCTFTSNELLAAFSALVQRAATPRPQAYLAFIRRG